MDDFHYRFKTKLALFIFVIIKDALMSTFQQLPYMDLKNKNNKKSKPKTPLNVYWWKERSENQRKRNCPLSIVCLSLLCITIAYILYSLACLFIIS